MPLRNDIIGLLKGLQIVTEACIEHQQSKLKYIWLNSSLRTSLEQPSSCNIDLKSANAKDVGNFVWDSADRISTIYAGVQTYARVSNNVQSVPNLSEVREFDIKLSQSDLELLRKLDMEHRDKLQKEAERETSKEHEESAISTGEVPAVAATPKPIVTAIPNPRQKLSDSSKQRTVPSSRIGRMMSFGGLAAGLGLGTAAEFAKRTLGIEKSTDNPLFLNPSNLERIVDTLCKVRGAALKLGQLMSIQDDSVVNPELSQALERVRKSADFMPDWQVDKVMSTEFGEDWRSLFFEFETKPFAAASIGQVHRGILPNQAEVAVKIQYPGVARGIDSDLDNLGGIMKMWNIFPPGMFLDNLMKVAKRELAWEVDYKREAECTKRFKQLMKKYPEYYVPTVIDELSSEQVFTTEMLQGIPVDQCFELPEDDRRFIGEKIIELCLLELLEFRYMQTDPNWANFLYDPKNRRIMLLDFGASREYPKAFMDQYVKILKSACDNDRETVLTVSRQLGFLTGYESKIMEEAHVDAVMILGEVFRCPGAYDFSTQDMTARIQNLVPTMLTHRLCPPPEEVYSLHRKLSGVFLLCSKLKTKVSCREKFLTLYNKYQDNS